MVTLYMNKKEPYSDLLSQQFEEEGIYTNPDPYKEYYCYENYKTTGFTLLMKWVLLIRKYPKLRNGIKQLIKFNKMIINIRATNGYTALMIAVENARKYSTRKTVQMLINGGADINIQDNYGETALMLASKYSSSTSTGRVLKILLKMGADPNLQTFNFGRTALMYASMYSNSTSTEKTVQMLINNGADVDLQAHCGETALMLASMFSNDISTVNTVQILIDGGSNVNLQDEEEGYTALMYAPECHKNTIQILIDAGADLHLKNDYDESSLDFIKNTFPEIYEKELKTKETNFL